MRPGWHDGDGVAISQAALTAIHNLAKAQPRIFQRVTVFPMLDGGVIVENDGYPCSFEITADPTGVMTAEFQISSFESDHWHPVVITCLPALLASRSMLVADEIRTLMDCDGPIVIEVETQAGNVIGMALPDDIGLGIADGAFIGVLPSPHFDTQFRKNLICLRSLMLLPVTTLFLFHPFPQNRDNHVIRMIPHLTVPTEAMLPEANLMAHDIFNVAAAQNITKNA